MTAPQYVLRLADGREFAPADLDLMEAWAREGRVPLGGLPARADDGSVQSVLSAPQLRLILQAPPTVGGGVPAQGPSGHEPMSGMIPYKNPPALVGYYTSILALLPMIGLLFGVVAVILGCIGLRKRIKDPRVRGLAHALIAIILGGLCAIAYGFALVAIIVARANR